MGNAAEVHPELVKRNITPDVVTDQTPAHDLMSYVPIGDVQELDKLREKNKRAYKEKVLDAIVDHVNAILTMQRNGAVCFDYGNNLRSQAEIGGRIHERLRRTLLVSWFCACIYTAFILPGKRAVPVGSIVG